MISKTTKNGFLKLTTSTGSKLFKLLFFFGFLGLTLQIIDSSYLQQQCRQQSSQNQQSWNCSIVSPLIGGLGSNFLQAVITIFVLDLGLKRETLEEIQVIINNAKPTRSIKEFFRYKKDYEHLINGSFSESIEGQEIKILCLFEDELLIFAGNLDNLRKKILDGCNLKILILHPESSLMYCLYQSKFTRKNNFSSISNAFLSKLDNLYQDLEKHYHPTSKKIKGSIEVKFHKNLFSPIGYYSDSKDCKIVWMYLSNSDGREYPAFHLGAQDLMDDTDKHFEHLWQEAGALLIRVTKDPASNLNEINKIRSSSSQT